LENNKIIIEPKQGWQKIDWNELWSYKDLFFFLIWRNIKTRYAQSILGIGWALIQPLFSMIIFTIIFGNIAKVSSDGVPYAIFSFTALVPWTYFTSALMDSSGSLINSTQLLTKVYFPRLVIPIAPVISKLVDFFLALIILFFLMIYFGFYPKMKLFILPILILLMMLSASGMGMWLTALAIQYRDIKYSMGFFVQLLMYLAPVVYPASAIPIEYRVLYGCFPMTGVIEGFRSILLETNPIPWDLIIPGFIIAFVLFFSGLFYFIRMEKRFADVA
tara:strand:+ start:533 stop:1357 length:825 start_codon:yes stop_codon:yes gene_type:complete